MKQFIIKAIWKTVLFVRRLLLILGVMLKGRIFSPYKVGLLIHMSKLHLRREQRYVNDYHFVSIITLIQKLRSGILFDNRSIKYYYQFLLPLKRFGPSRHKCCP